MHTPPTRSPIYAGGFYNPPQLWGDCNILHFPAYLKCRSHTKYSEGKAVICVGVVGLSKRSFRTAIGEADANSWPVLCDGSQYLAVDRSIPYLQQHERIIPDGNRHVINMKETSPMVTHMLST